MYSYKAKRNIVIIQPACNGQREQRWRLSSSSAFGEDRRDAVPGHAACAQRNVFGGYFLLKQIGGWQYYVAVIKKDVDFPKGFTTGLQPRVAYTLCHMAVICHFTPSLEETWLSKPLFLAAAFAMKSEPAFFSLTTCWIQPSLLAARAIAIWWMVGLSPVPCWGKNPAHLTTGLSRFWQSSQHGTAWGAPHHPLKDVPLHRGHGRDALPHCTSLERAKHAPAPPTSRYLQRPLTLKNMDTLGLIHRSWDLTFQSRQSLDRSEQTRVEKGLSAAPSSCSSKPTTEPWWAAETKLQACCHITPVQTVYCPLDASPCQHQYPNFSCYKQRLSESN